MDGADQLCVALRPQYALAGLILARSAIDPVDQDSMRKSVAPSGGHGEQTSTITDIANLPEAFANAPALIYSFDASGTFTFSAGGGGARLGVLKDGLVGKSLRDLFPSEHQVLGNLARLSEGEYVHSVRRLGEYTFESWVSPRFTTDGRFDGGVGFSIDISEHARAKQQVARLLSMLEATPDIVAICDSDGRFQYLNPAGHRKLGLRDSEPESSLSIQQLQSAGPDTLDDNSLCNLAHAEGSWTGERTFRRRDGTLLALHVSVHSHTDGAGELEYFSLIAQDQTKQKAAIDRILLQAELLDCVAQAVLATNLDGRIVYWNRAAEEIFGRSPAEVEGALLADLRLADGDVLKVLEEPIANGRRWNGDVTMRGASGDSFPARVNVSPSRDQSRRRIGSVITVSDATEQVELQERLTQATKMEAIGRLAGGIAHDFNNLLTAMRGFATFALEDLPDDSPARGDIGEVLAAADRAAEMTRQLLAFSRKQMLREEPVDVNQIVTEMEQMLRRLIGEHINLDIALATDPVVTVGDPGQLQQVLMNLVVNARDAISRTGTIRIETGMRLVDAAAARRTHWHIEPGDYVELCVADTGKGMTSETVANIFEPFFTTKEEGEGTGLGLATVYGIVKQSGGHILVDSTPDRGSRFTVLLKRGENAAAPSATVSFDAPDAAGSECILVVEDDPAVRRIAQRALQELGYKVHSAGGGAEALGLAPAIPDLQLVVTDVVMPGMSGPQLASQLRETIPGIEVLFTSGYTQDDLVRQGLRREEVSFLEKPFSPEKLGHAVRATLGRRRAGRIRKA